MKFLDTPYGIEREEADLYVEQVGPADGQVVLFLHGGPGYHSFSFRQLFGEELEGYRMIYADQRGSGRSYSTAPFDLDALADDVRAIFDALGIDRGSLLGHGFGAQIAVRAAGAFPGRFDRLVLVNPWFSMPLLARSLQREAQRFGGRGAPPVEPNQGEAGPEEVQGLLQEAFSQVPAKQLLDHLEFPNPASRLRLEHSDSEALLAPVEGAAPEEFWQLTVLAELPGLLPPVVLLAGKQDGTSFPDQIEAGLTRLPTALVSLLDAGHYPWLDAPEDFLEILTEALRVGPP